MGTPGLLQPLPILEHTWVDISMDFIDDLLKSYGKSIIMVIMVHLFKYTHVYPLAHPYKAINVAYLFIDNIIKFYGMPSIIVNDHDPSFTNKFW